MTTFECIRDSIGMIGNIGTAVAAWFGVRGYLSSRQDAQTLAEHRLKESLRKEARASLEAIIKAGKPRLLEYCQEFKARGLTREELRNMVWIQLLEAGSTLEHTDLWANRVYSELA